jgi:myo-inositol-1(or 4)-monophosphatase
MAVYKHRLLLYPDHHPGLPMFGASIGVVKLSNTVTSPEIVVGVIYNPILDELTCAVRGEGCFLNGNRIVHKQVPDDFRIELKDALVCVGFPASSPSALVASSKAVSVLSSKVRGIRMIASAAQVMCWVAQGKLSAYIGWNLNAWDATAGILIIEESGGCLRNFDGTKADISSRDMIMTCYENKYHHHHLNDEIRQLMARTNCLEYDH